MAVIHPPDSGLTNLFYAKPKTRKKKSSDPHARFLVNGKWISKKPKDINKIQAVEIHQLMTLKQIVELFPNTSINISLD